jgi:hypothetical protein
MNLRKVSNTLRVMQTCVLGHWPMREAAVPDKLATFAKRESIPKELAYRLEGDQAIASSGSSCRQGWPAPSN